MWEYAAAAAFGSAATLATDGIRHWLRSRHRRRRILGQLRIEVTHIAEYLDAQFDIARQMIAAFDRQEVLPGGSPPPPATVYRAYIAEVAMDISSDHLLRLNVLYNGAASVHAFLEGTEVRFLRLCEHRDHGFAATVVQDSVRDMAGYLQTLKRVAQQFLSDSPEPFHLLERRPTDHPFRSTS